MLTYLNHTAFDVKEFDWYKAFFTDVCCMHSYKEAGTAPARQLWFTEGIQLNENPAPGAAVSSFNHIGMLTEDVEAFVAAALAAGCSPLPNKPTWFALPNGAKVEVRKIGDVPEVRH